MMQTNTIRNIIGYLQFEMSYIQNQLSILDNSLTQAERDNAELEVIKSAKNIGKITKTIEEKMKCVMPTTGYTNAELTEKGII